MGPLKLIVHKYLKVIGQVNKATGISKAILINVKRWKSSAGQVISVEY